MRKLIVEEWLSLDGFATDKDGQLDFFTNLTAEQNSQSDAEQLKFLDTIDLILLGRKTYELFVEFWPAATTDQEVIADKLNSLKKIVFSNTIVSAPWGTWPEAEVRNGDAVRAIRDLKQLPGRNIVIWGSISLVQELMKANLIDEYHIQLCPVLTRGGRSFYNLDIDPQQLKLVEMRQYSTGTVFLNYQLT